MPSLTAFAGSGRILFGSDFPYAPAVIGASFTSKLDADDDLSADEHRAIGNGNAKALFPRLVPRKEMADAPGRVSPAGPLRRKGAR